MNQTQQIQHSRFVNRSPIYYGWVVWAVATLGIIATSPGQSYTVFLFIDNFIADFGLDRTTVSGLYGLGTFIGAMSLTWVGRRIDRHGNRHIGVAVSGLFALALLGMSLITGPFGLLLGFIAIRGLGQGALGLVNSTAIAQWFMQRRGRVMSLMLVSISLFQVVYVPWLERLLATTDWRQVWVVLGIGVGVTVPPLIWLLMRNRPEDFGLLPDGIKLPEEKVSSDKSETFIEEDNWTLREAMQTSIFWIFLAGRILSPAWVTGLVIHHVSLFDSLGYANAASVAAQTWSLAALISAGVALGAGTMVDRFRPGRILILQLSAFIVALGVAMVMTETWMLYVYAGGCGLLMGIGGVFDGAVWTNLFGRQHQGAIRGFVVSVLVVGAALGPVVFGLSYDYLGGYNAALQLGIVLALIPLVLNFFVREPQRKQKQPKLGMQVGD